MAVAKIVKAGGQAEAIPLDGAHTKTPANSFTHHKEFFPETARRNLP